MEKLSLDNLLDHMRGAPNSKITLTIKREGVDRPLVISMRRAIVHIEVVKQRMQQGRIGYVRLTEFTEKADAGLKQAVSSLRQQAGGRLKALILDLRNNPGGLIVGEIPPADPALIRGLARTIKLPTSPPADGRQCHRFRCTRRVGVPMTS